MIWHEGNVNHTSFDLMPVGVKLHHLQLLFKYKFNPSEQVKCFVPADFFFFNLVFQYWIYYPEVLV